MHCSFRCNLLKSLGDRRDGTLSAASVSFQKDCTRNITHMVSFGGRAGVHVCSCCLRDPSSDPGIVPHSSQKTVNNVFVDVPMICVLGASCRTVPCRFPRKRHSHILVAMQVLMVSLFLFVPCGTGCLRETRCEAHECDSSEPNHNYPMQAGEKALRRSTQ